MMAVAALDDRAPERLNLRLPVLVFALALIPLFLTPVIPSADFNAHLLRYFILADNGATEHLARNYQPDWKLVPNLGLDVLGTMLLKFLPPLVAGKVIAAIVMFAPFGGTLFLAHAVQGRITVLSTVLAGLLIFSHIFVWGFTNFLLGIGIGLAGLGLWYKNRNRPAVQLAGAAVLGAGLMLVHALAFAVWGLMLAALELGLAIENRTVQPKQLLFRVLRLGAVAVIPFGIFLSSHTADAQGGITSSISNLQKYADNGGLVSRLTLEIVERVDILLRISDSLTPWADRVIGGLLWLIILVGLLQGALKLVPSLRLPVLTAIVLAVFMPPNMFGSGYVNDRFPLLLMCLLAAGLSLDAARREANAVVAAISALLAIHLGLVTFQFWQAGRQFDQMMEQIASVNTGDVAGYLVFGDAHRDGLLPYCNPMLALIALVNGTAVQTFSNPTQQPLKLTGRLATAMKSYATKLPPDVSRVGEGDLEDWKLGRVRADLSRGFDTLLVCGGGGLVPDGEGVIAIASGEYWAVYRAKPATGAEQ